MSRIIPRVLYSEANLGAFCEERFLPMVVHANRGPGFELFAVCEFSDVTGALLFEIAAKLTVLNCVGDRDVVWQVSWPIDPRTQVNTVERQVTHWFADVRHLVVVMHKGLKWKVRLIAKKKTHASNKASMLFMKLSKIFWGQYLTLNTENPLRYCNFILLKLKIYIRLVS